MERLLPTGLDRRVPGRTGRANGNSRLRSCRLREGARHLGTPPRGDSPCTCGRGDCSTRPIVRSSRERPADARGGRRRSEAIDLQADATAGHTGPGIGIPEAADIDVVDGAVDSLVDSLVDDVVGGAAAVCTAVHVGQKNGCTLHPLSVFAGRFRTLLAECRKCVSHGVLPCFLAFSWCLAIAFEDRGGHQPANRFRRMCYRVCFQLWGSSSVRPPTPVFLSARTRRTTPAR